jgi:hypothetical protein
MLPMNAGYKWRLIAESEQASRLEVVSNTTGTGRQPGEWFGHNDDT